jgi:hypothetical protein
MILVYLAIIFALSIFGIDRYLRLRDVENDLKLLLGDFLVARDVAEGRARVHYQASALAVKSLIKNHFKD